MASLTDIREDMSLRLQEIHGLNCYARVPSSLEPPAIVVGMPETLDYNLTYGPTGVTYLIPVRLYVTRMDAEEAQAIMDPYIAPTGSTSIKAALEASTVEACWHVIVVAKAQDFGVYQVAGVDYLGCEFQVEVIAT